MAAPVASPGGSDPLGIDKTLSNLGLLPSTPPLPSSPRAVSPASAPSSSDALDLEQTLDSLLGAANGEQPGSSTLGGIKKRTSDLSSPAGSLDLNSLLGELTGSQKRDTNDLSGIVPTMKRTPQGSSGITVDGVPVPVDSVLGLVGELGAAR